MLLRVEEYPPERQLRGRDWIGSTLGTAGVGPSFLSLPEIPIHGEPEDVYMRA